MQGMRVVWLRQPARTEFLSAAAEPWLASRACPVFSPPWNNWKVFLPGEFGHISRLSELTDRGPLHGPLFTVTETGPKLTPRKRSLCEAGRRRDFFPPFVSFFPLFLFPRSLVGYSSSDVVFRANSEVIFGIDSGHYQDESLSFFLSPLFSRGNSLLSFWGRFLSSLPWTIVGRTKRRCYSGRFDFQLVLSPVRTLETSKFGASIEVGGEGRTYGDITPSGNTH